MTAPSLPSCVNAELHALDALGACVSLKDIHGRYLYANQTFLDFLGLQADAVLGKTDADFFAPEQVSVRVMQEQGQIVQGQGWAGSEQLCLLGQHAVHSFWSEKRMVHAADGTFVGLSCVALDVTEREREEAQALQRKDLMAFILDNLNAYIYMEGEDRRYRYVNKKVADDMRLPAEKVIGQRDIDVMNPIDADYVWEHDRKVFETNTRQVREESFRFPDGRLRQFWSESNPYQYTPTCRTLIGVSVDITELHEIKEELKRQTQTDVLTGLFNRRYFSEVAEREFSRAKRYHEPLSLFVIDVDFFKAINDTYGHPVGDLVLHDVAQKCLESVRAVDILARIGGEEFVVLLPQTPAATEANPTLAFDLAQRIRTAIGGLVLTGAWEGEICPKVSIGVASRLDADEDFHTIYQRADRALYTAKHTGRNRVCVQEANVPAPDPD